jgi:glyoxylase-like metal-dependent hydrolase (beta-lactamase superfamily II)
MRIEQISEHIWSLRTWMLIPVHVWLVVDEEGVTLVDAGISSMGKGIIECVAKLKGGPLQRIVLTHGHSDHTGAIELVRKNAPVPVFAHRTEIPFMEGKLAYPRRKKAVASVAPGLAQPLPETPDGQLQSIGGLTPYHAPGHSPGHVVYYHEQDDVLLAGDLFTSRKGKLRRPMAIFTADMQEAVQSAAIVQKLQPKRIEVCHGTPVLEPAAQLEAYLTLSLKQIRT